MTLTFKRYIGLPILLALLASALVLGAGDQRIHAYSVRAAGPVVEEVAVEEAVTLGSEAALSLAAATGSIQVLH